MKARVEPAAGQASDSDELSAQPGPGRGPLLYAVVFMAGATTMGTEMAGSRLLAPYFGTSLYIWAVLIGLIMVYLTAGYFLGGKFADAHPRREVLFRLTVIAGFCVGLIPLLSRPILNWATVGFSQLSAGIFLGSLVAVLMLFAAPLIALGCVSPFAVRLALQQVRTAGNVAGGMYALSTMGSLIGTFGTVFLLIPSIGTRRTFLVMSAALMVTSLAGLWRKSPAYLLLLLPVIAQLAFPAGPVRAADGGRIVYEGESAYYYIQVIQHGEVRELVLDEGHAVHSVYDPHRLLTGQYWDYFLGAPLFARHFRRSSVQRIAILGLGGGTAARLFDHVYPAARLDAAEIDPQVVSVARRYFGLHEARLHVWTEDARYFLLTRPATYDLVAIDAFRQPYIPFQLTTKEFFELVRSHLRPGGTVAINAGHTATDFRLVDALARTMATVFPSVYIVDVPGTINSLVIASRDRITRADVSTNVSHASGITRSVGEEILHRSDLRPAPSGGQVFTDDLAPVEQLIDQIVLDYVRSSGDES